jgi:hypothetical protein
MQTHCALTSEGQVLYGLAPGSQEFRVVVQGLFREASVQARMKHPNIVHVYAPCLV